MRDTPFFDEFMKNQSDDVHKAFNKLSEDAKHEFVDTCAKCAVVDTARRDQGITMLVNKCYVCGCGECVGLLNLAVSFAEQVHKLDKTYGSDILYAINNMDKFLGQVEVCKLAIIELNTRLIEINKKLGDTPEDQAKQKHQLAMITKTLFGQEQSVTRH